MNMQRDNKTSITLTKNPENQDQTKHIDIIYHYIRGLVKKGELSIKWIASSIMLIDGLTKTLLVVSFKKHWDKWDLVE